MRSFRRAALLIDGELASSIAEVMLYSRVYHATKVGEGHSMEEAKKAVLQLAAVAKRSCNHHFYRHDTTTAPTTTTLCDNHNHPHITTTTTATR